MAADEPSLVRDEAKCANNHGTFYDVQAMEIALVLGQNEAAKARIQH